MTGDWLNTQLSEIAEKSKRAFAMGPFGSNIKAENYRDSGVPVLRGTNLGGPGEAPFKASDFVFLTEEKADELASSNAHPNDIVFVAQGTVGKVGIIPSNISYPRLVLSQNLMKVTVDSQKADPRLVFYFFRSAQGQHEIMSRVNPTGVPCISKPLTSLRQFSVLIPSDIKVQRAIAHILGTLDDKIELNRQMNETLEGIARAIFRSWFVDFDPVRVKAAGQQPPGLKLDLAALFPDAFEDSELGEIPRGWRVATLADVSEKPQYGYTASASDEPIGPRFLRITDINKQDWIEWQHVPFCPIEERDRSKYLLKRGDIVIARIADPGHGAMIEEDIDAVFASYLIRFRPRQPEFGRFLQYWLRSERYWNLVRARQSGTTRANLNAQVLGAFSLIVPESRVLQTFSAQVDALRDKLMSNVRESLILVALRDTLLSKLISGELRVKDTERIIRRIV